MKDAEKEALDVDRKKLSLKTMYFNRYLFIRYLSAGFFFTNLYWLILLYLGQSKVLFLPLFLIIIILTSVFEQAKLYSTPTNVVPRTTNYYRLQLVVSSGLLLATFTPLFPILFPFMNQGKNGRIFIAVLLLIGCLLCLWIQKRLENISSNSDKHYQRIKQYEKSLYL